MFLLCLVYVKHVVLEKTSRHWSSRRRDWFCDHR